MNVREGVDMTKAAIGCLLLTLLIGAVMGMWYYMYHTENSFEKKMDDAATSSAADKLWDLHYHCQYDKEISVPTAVSAISEFDDGELFYVRIVALNIGDSIRLDECYLPQNFLSDNTVSVTCDSDTKLLDGEFRYLNAACKRLLQYSSYSCKVIVSNVNDSIKDPGDPTKSDFKINKSDNKMLCVTVVVTDNS